MSSAHYLKHSKKKTKSYKGAPTGVSLALLRTVNKSSIAGSTDLARELGVKQPRISELAGPPTKHDSLRNPFTSPGSNHLAQGHKMREPPRQTQRRSGNASASQFSIGPVQNGTTGRVIFGTVTLEDGRLLGFFGDRERLPGTTHPSQRELLFRGVGKDLSDSKRGICKADLTAKSLAQ